ncbi:MAG: DNA photolyase, partial [Chloroflexi bacterium]
MQLRTDLTTRTEQAAYLADVLAGLYQGSATPSP